MLNPGEKIFYEVIFLEYYFHSNFKIKKNKKNFFFVYKFKNSSAKSFLKLYNKVGYNYEWNDMLNVKQKIIRELIQNQQVDFFLFFKNLNLLGFFILDFRKKGVADLMYFGLLPKAIGLGYGKNMLKIAIDESYKKKVKKITVNTNNLDHPRALPLYKKNGFRPSKKEIHSRTLVKQNAQKGFSDFLKGKYYV